MQSFPTKLMVLIVFSRFLFSCPSAVSVKLSCPRLGVHFDTRKQISHNASGADEVTPVGGEGSGQAAAVLAEITELEFRLPDTQHLTIQVCELSRPPRVNLKYGWALRDS